ncbi:hypothetical protein CUMW_138900 [Citrus unshiu]|uniref:Uncharacterized protein n=1 Tax=Citrus unshiu TaxID=55188 RepID=A0A2H5PI54_CITUN|nr:hypothetical protein CUMW_138900 [Citrus unshiu]
MICERGCEEAFTLSVGISEELSRCIYVFFNNLLANIIGYIISRALSVSSPKEKKFPWRFLGRPQLSLH